MIKNLNICFLILFAFVFFTTSSHAKNHFEIDPFLAKIKITHDAELKILDPILKVICTKAEKNIFNTTQELPVSFESKILPLSDTASVIKLESKNTQKFENPFSFSFFQPRDCNLLVYLAVEDPRIPSPSPEISFNGTRMKNLFSHYAFIFKGDSKATQHLRSLSAVELQVNYYPGGKVQTTNTSSDLYYWHLVLHPKEEKEIDLESYPYLYTRSPRILGDEKSP